MEFLIDLLYKLAHTIHIVTFILGPELALNIYTSLFSVCTLSKLPLFVMTASWNRFQFLYIPDMLLPSFKLFSSQDVLMFMYERNVIRNGISNLYIQSD